MTENSAPADLIQGRIWTFGHCEYNEIRRQLFVNKTLVHMESKPLDLLQLLLERPLEVLSKDVLLSTAWDAYTSDQSVTTAVSKLRKAFGGSRDSVILNVSGAGYRMAIPVACVLDGHSTPAPLQLNPGDHLPGNDLWIAVRSLGIRDAQAVWLAEHGKTHEAHVFKFATDGIRLRSLQREVALSRLLQHNSKNDPRFAKILTWNFEHLPFFIESEYSGLNLFEFAERPEFQAMPADERVKLAADLASAVAAAHSLGILHNDLKPSNILVEPRGQNGLSPAFLARDWQVKVVDFGVASLSDPSRLLELHITDHGEFNGYPETGSTSAPVGTALYRAPELLKLGATPTIQADVYSLGVILYQILCGDLLASPVAGWEARIPDPLLREDIAAAANIDPALRLATAAELAENLRTLETRRTERLAEQRVRADRQRDEAAIARQRLLRPWVAALICALILGIGFSLWFYHRALHQRDLAIARADTLAAMNGFLGTDLLSQSNPLLATARNGPTQQETLIQAIARAAPQIDRRFVHDPEIAAQLHMTLGSALDARANSAAAVVEFAAAAQRFRDEEGPLSQRAISAELRGENSLMRTQSQPLIEQARTEYANDKKLIDTIPSRSPELQGWQAMVQSGDLLFSSNSEPAIEILNSAVKRAEATPGFSPSLLSALRLRICGVYLKLNRAPEAERIARQSIAAATSTETGSPSLFQERMFLEEALSMQGKNEEAKEQSSRDYEDFLRTLGPSNHLTLSALYMRAASEGSLEQYDDAIRDSLAVRDAAHNSTVGPFLPADALLQAATFECAGGHIEAGIAHARQVVQEAGPGPAAQPFFVEDGKFTLASCFLDQQEHATRPSRAVVDEIGNLVAGLQLPILQSQVTSGLEGHIALVKARLAAIRGQNQEARKELATAKSLLPGDLADREDRRTISRLQQTLTLAK